MRICLVLALRCWLWVVFLFGDFLCGWINGWNESDYCTWRNKQETDRREKEIAQKKPIIVLIVSSSCAHLQVDNRSGRGFVVKWLIIIRAYILDWWAVQLTLDSCYHRREVDFKIVVKPRKNIYTQNIAQQTIISTKEWQREQLTKVGKYVVG